MAPVRRRRRLQVATRHNENWLGRGWSKICLRWCTHRKHKIHGNIFWKSTKQNGTKTNNNQTHDADKRIENSTHDAHFDVKSIWQNQNVTRSLKLVFTTHRNGGCLENRHHRLGMIHQRQWLGAVLDRYSSNCSKISLPPRTETIWLA